jgi:hypothetical protein
MPPRNRVKTPVPAASWISLGRMRAVAALAAVALVVLAGCNPDSCDDEDDCPPPPDARPMADAGTMETAAPTLDSAPDAPAIQLPPPPATCEERPSPRHEGAPVHTFTVKPTLGGQAVELGVPVMAGGVRVTLSQLRFFVTRPVLVGRAGQAPVAAELVDATGKLLPYGLSLLDLEKPDSLTLRLRAPAGQYDRLSLSIGVYPACNSGPQPAALVYPLNAGGGMTWTWTSGYIFVFMEGSKGASPGAPFAAHGGIFPPSAGAVPLDAAGAFGPSAPTVLEARLDRLVEAVDGQNHIEGGMKLMERLPTAEFWRMSSP